MTEYVGKLLSAGGPLFPPALLRAAQRGLWCWPWHFRCILVNFVWIQGSDQVPVKIVLLSRAYPFGGTAIRAWRAVLVGIALFEVFHDVQYLSLVWIYNRKRVRSDSSIGGFMRFVFRRSARS